MFLIGYDLGSSSIKVSLLDANSGRCVGVVKYPEEEMPIAAPQPGWAEQDPELWWEYCGIATRQLLARYAVAPEAIAALGLAYQMHGLVLVDDAHRVIRPAIIWCDSRAVEIGKRAWEALGREACLQHLLNSPGNFTASKLKWVRDHEPAHYRRIHKAMLPGDYLAMKMTGHIRSTLSGLSEGIFWNFTENDLAHRLLDHYGLEPSLLPELVPTFGEQGQLTASAAEALGLRAGIPLTYRAGDQPNNALSLNVLRPGEVAATGGTSGVVYGVLARLAYAPPSRVNSFAHVNHRAERPRIGVLLCINGAGIQYRWIKQRVGAVGLSYSEMEARAAAVPIGSDGVRLLPFGNGAERVLGNRSPGARINNLQFNRHGEEHLFRAALEGIAFSFVYGVEILRDLGLDLRVIRVGNDNLFRSAIFAQTIAALVGSPIEVLESTGATGAARAAGVGVGIYSDVAAALSGERIQQTYLPPAAAAYAAAYEDWRRDLDQLI